MFNLLVTFGLRQQWDLIALKAAFYFKNQIGTPILWTESNKVLGNVGLAPASGNASASVLLDVVISGFCYQEDKLALGFQQLPPCVRHRSQGAPETEADRLRLQCQALGVRGGCVCSGCGSGLMSLRGKRI